MALAQARFAAMDWMVVAAYFVLTTLIGAKLAGKQATIRDFFLGGRKLPWWAISGSIVATEISAITVVGVPTISYAQGGDFTYLQLALGSILARVIVAYYFVEKYYEHEIYSPYDYVGARLGPRVKHVTTALFLLGAVLGQGARVYIAASLLGVVAGIDLVAAIWLMGAFGVGWTLLGGMTTVVWTDVIQFVVIVLGAVIALWTSIAAVPGSVSEVLQLGSAAGKFRVLNFTPDLSLEYTFWCGILALPFLNLAAFGTDQVMAQRMFCCRTKADARRAILWSNVSLLIPVLLLGVGVALFAYFSHHTLSPDEQARYDANPNSLFPTFIVRALPVGVRGVIVAAIFAAAISTLEGALAALSQTTVSFFVRPADLDAAVASSGKKAVIWSKVAVIAWGVVLCLMGTACIDLARGYKNVIDLALSLVRYTYGPLLGVFVLAFLPKRRDDAGLIWAVAAALLLVLAMSVHEVRIAWLGWLASDPALLAERLTWIAALAFAACGIIRFARDGKRAALVAAAGAAMVLLHYFHLGVDAAGRRIFPSPYWHYPLATFATLVLAFALGQPREKKTPGDA